MQPLCDDVNVRLSMQCQSPNACNHHNFILLCLSKYVSQMFDANTLLLDILPQRISLILSQLNYIVTEIILLVFDIILYLILIKETVHWLYVIHVYIL